MSQPPLVLSPELSRKLENKKRVIFYLTLALLAAGSVGFVGIASVALPIEKERMIITALCIGGALSAVFAMVITRLLSGYATTTRAILPTILVGAVGWVLCSWAALLYLNVALDRSGVTIRPVRFVLRQEVEGKKPLLLAAVPSWKDKNKKKVIVFPVTREVYDQLEDGVCRVMTRAGYFGFEWIVSTACP